MPRLPHGFSCAPQLHAYARRVTSILFVLLVGCILLAGCGGNVQSGPSTQVKTTPLLHWAIPAAITYGRPLDGTQLNATTSVAGSFSYSPAAGDVLTAGSHMLTVSFTPADSTLYNSAAASVELTVNRATPVISWTQPEAVTYGTVLGSAQLNATSNIEGSIRYTPVTGSVPDAGTQTLTATLTPTDTTNYLPASTTVNLTVSKAAPVLSWNAPAAISYGTPLSATQLNATANVAGSFSYTPAAGSVLGAGAQQITAKFTPTDSNNYQSASSSVTLQVSKNTPAITWNTPSAINYGTALSATQLNATANVAGSFSYTPAAGSVLEPGTYNLSVEFTPQDGSNYAAATGTVSLTINKLIPVILWSLPAAIPYGTALSSAQLNATCNVSGSVSYNPAAGTVLEAGSEVLSSTCTPADSSHYETTSYSVPLTVKQATPVINWTPPDSVPQGVELDSSQLNATATSPLDGSPLPGSFSYTPAAGTRFTSTGTQTLQATYTPSDTVNFSAPKSTRSIAVTSFGIVAWGDSVTSGGQGYVQAAKYPALLANEVVLSAVNMGVPGQTSTQIAVRQGAVATYATVTGGVIPASGGVTVTFPKGYEPVTMYGPGGGTTGSIQGVAGRVTLSSGVYTFTRTTAGDAVALSGATQFVPDMPYSNYLPVIMAGNCNVTDTAQVLSDIAAMVASVKDGGDYLVLSLLNGGTDGKDWRGGVQYQAMVTINTQLAATYGKHYIDVHKLLVNAYDPTQATDLEDFQNDVPPLSLRPIYSQGTLSSDIGVNDTTIPVTVAGGNLNANPVVVIDTGANAESVLVTAINGNTLTVKRCFTGACVAHSAGASFTVTDVGHFRSKGYQIIADAVAAYLSAYAK